MTTALIPTAKVKSLNCTLFRFNVLDFECLISYVLDEPLQRQLHP